MNEQTEIAQLRYNLTTAPRCDLVKLDDLEYNDVVRITAGEIVRWASHHETLYDQTAEDIEYDWANDPDHGRAGMNPEYVIKKGLYNVMKRSGVQLQRLGLSGAQWHMAYGLAALCLGRK